MATHVAMERTHWVTWRERAWGKPPQDLVSGRQAGFAEPLQLTVRLDRSDFDEFYLGKRAISSLSFEVHVRIDSTYPVAYIRSLEGNDAPELWGPVVVRRLCRIFPWAGGETGSVRLQAANVDDYFIVAVNTSKNEKVHGVSVTSRRGVDVISANVPDDGDPRVTAQDWLTPHFELIGDVLSTRRHDDARIDLIEDRVRELRELYLARGLRAWYSRTVKTRRDLTSLTLLLYDLQDDIRFSQRDFSERAERAYADGEFGELYPIVQREIADNASDQIDIWRSRLAALGDLQARASQLAGVIVASVLGGVAGAGFTLLAQLGS